MLESIIPAAVLEAVNWTAVALFIQLAIVFGFYIISKLREYDWRLGALNYYEVGAAKAMMTMAIGDAIIRGSVAYSRHLLNHHRVIDNEAWTPFITSLVIFGTLVLTAGAMCMIRVLVNERRVGLGPLRWTWLSCGALAIGFGVLMAAT